MNPIKKIRRDAGLNQLDFARHIHTTQPTLSKLENDGVCPTCTTLYWLRFITSWENIETVIIYFADKTVSKGEYL